MASETPIREHHLSVAELRAFFAERRSERDLREALAEGEGAVPSLPDANED